MLLRMLITSSALGLKEGSKTVQGSYIFARHRHSLACFSAYFRWCSGV